MPTSSSSACIDAVRAEAAKPIGVAPREEALGELSFLRALGAENPERGREALRKRTHY